MWIRWPFLFKRLTIATSDPTTVSFGCVLDAAHMREEHHTVVSYASPRLSVLEETIHILFINIEHVQN
jgi:hypothetical protein